MQARWGGIELRAFSSFCLSWAKHLPCLALTFLNRRRRGHRRSTAELHAELWFFSFCHLTSQNLRGSRLNCAADVYLRGSYHEAETCLISVLQLSFLWWLPADMATMYRKCPRPLLGLTGCLYSQQAQPQCFLRGGFAQAHPSPWGPPLHQRPQSTVGVVINPQSGQGWEGRPILTNQSPVSSALPQTSNQWYWESVTITAGNLLIIGDIRILK